MSKKLFLIGNGFDIAHGLKTRYLDLLNFIYENDIETFEKFNSLLIRNFYDQNGYNADWIWEKPSSDVEKRIKSLDFECIKSTDEYKCLDCVFDNEALDLYVLWESLEEHMHYSLLDKEIEDIGIERDTIREIFEEEDYGPITEDDIDQIDRPAQNYFDSLVSKLAENFKSNLISWIKSINDDISELSNNLDFYGNEMGKDYINLLEEDFFGKDNYIINFNYSRTVEELYSQKVLHIHGEEGNENNLPVMGHAKRREKFNYSEKELILVQKFYKNFEKIIEKMLSSFQNWKM